MKDKYLFGVVGHKIGYSLSPQIFQTISKITGVPCDFKSHDIAPRRFNIDFPEVLKSGIDGFSVTIPFKNRVAEYLDEVDVSAVAVGAVNSIGIKDGRVFGYNTDSYGFSLPLLKHSDKLHGGAALVFGAGGAAKAIVHSLATRFKMRRVCVFARSAVKFAEFKQCLQENIPSLNIEGGLIEDYDPQSYEPYDIVVNCTPLGGWNHLDESPLPSSFNWLAGKIYCDLSYNRGNKIVASAAKQALTAYDGSIMLIGQALRSLELWTGIKVEFEPVYGEVFGGV
ncbi:MAG: shikimate dehydrogenase [Candidatus Zixiibacteriota bacterium]